MRLVFAGTPEIARDILEILTDSGVHQVVGVITQPDKPIGRHRSTLVAPPVKELAAQRGVPVVQPERLDSAEVTCWLRDMGPEAVVVAAYGKIVPAELLSAVERGFINVHPSLLPRWRGAAPIQRAILDGDAETGVCIMQMDAELDTGAVWASETVEMGLDETAGELAGRLGQVGGRLLVETLSAMEEGRLTEPVPQAADGACYAAKVEPADVAIDWAEPALESHRKVLAGNPRPGAVAMTHLGPLKVWRSRIGRRSNRPPGTVTGLGPGVAVSTGDGELVLLEVQPAGKGRMSAGEFARGRRIEVGERLDAEPGPHGAA